DIGKGVELAITSRRVKFQRRISRERPPADIEHAVCAENSGFQYIGVGAGIIKRDQSIPVHVGEKRAAYVIITTVNQNRGGCRSIATVERDCRAVSDVCVAGNIHFDNASNANDTTPAVIDLSRQRIRADVLRCDGNARNLIHYSAVVLNVEESVAVSGYVAGHGQANNASSPDFSPIV